MGAQGEEYVHSTTFSVQNYADVPGSGTIHGMCILPNGCMLISRLGSGVYGLQPWGSGTARLPLPPCVKSPRGMALLGTTVLLCDAGAHCIWAMSPSGRDVRLFLGHPHLPGWRDGHDASKALLKNPSAVAVSSSGELVSIADTGNHCIRVARLDPEGVPLAVITVAGRPLPGYVDGYQTASMLHSPAEVIWSSDFMVVCDAGNHSIRIVAEERPGLWRTSTVAGCGRAGVRDCRASGAMFNRPSGLAFTASGSLLVADRNNSRIRAVCSGRVVTLAGHTGKGARGGPLGQAQMSCPTLLACLGINDTVFFADSNSSRIRMVRKDTQNEAAHRRKSSSGVGPASPAAALNPLGVGTPRSSGEPPPPPPVLGAPPDCLMHEILSFDRDERAVSEDVVRRWGGEEAQQRGDRGSRHHPHHHGAGYSASGRSQRDGVAPVTPERKRAAPRTLHSAAYAGDAFDPSSDTAAGPVEGGGVGWQPGSGSRQRVRGEQRVVVTPRCSVRAQEDTDELIPPPSAFRAAVVGREAQQGRGGGVSPPPPPPPPSGEEHLRRDQHHQPQQQQRGSPPPSPSDAFLSPAEGGGGGGAAARLSTCRPPQISTAESECPSLPEQPQSLSSAGEGAGGGGDSRLPDPHPPHRHHGAADAGGDGVAWGADAADIPGCPPPALASPDALEGEGRGGHHHHHLPHPHRRGGDAAASPLQQRQQQRCRAKASVLLEGVSLAEKEVAGVFTRWASLGGGGGQGMSCMQWLRLLGHCRLLHHQQHHGGISAASASIAFFTSAGKSRHLSFDAFCRALNLVASTMEPPMKAAHLVWSHLLPFSAGPTQAALPLEESILEPRVLTLLAVNEDCLLGIFRHFVEKHKPAAVRAGGAAPSLKEQRVREKLLNPQGWLAFLRRFGVLPGLASRQASEGFLRDAVSGTLFAALTRSTRSIDLEVDFLRRGTVHLNPDAPQLLSFPEFLDAICRTALHCYTGSPEDRLASLLSSMGHSPGASSFGSPPLFETPLSRSLQGSGGGAAAATPTPHRGDVYGEKFARRDPSCNVLLPALRGAVGVEGGGGSVRSTHPISNAGGALACMGEGGRAALLRERFSALRGGGVATPQRGWVAEGGLADTPEAAEEWEARRRLSFDDEAFPVPSALSPEGGPAGDPTSATALRQPRGGQHRQQVGRRASRSRETPTPSGGVVRLFSQSVTIIQCRQGGGVGGSGGGAATAALPPPGVPPLSPAHRGVAAAVPRRRRGSLSSAASSSRSVIPFSLGEGGESGSGGAVWGVPVEAGGGASTTASSYTLVEVGEGAESLRGSSSSSSRSGGGGGSELSDATGETSIQASSLQPFVDEESEVGGSVACRAVVGVATSSSSSSGSASTSVRLVVVEDTTATDTSLSPVSRHSLSPISAPAAAMRFPLSRLLDEALRNGGAEAAASTPREATECEETVPVRSAGGGPAGSTSTPSSSSSSLSSCPSTVAASPLVPGGGGSEEEKERAWRGRGGRAASASSSVSSSSGGGGASSRGGESSISFRGVDTASVSVASRRGARHGGLSPGTHPSEIVMSLATSSSSSLSSVTSDLGSPTQEAASAPRRRLSSASSSLLLESRRTEGTVEDISIDLTSE